jgi:hypothetical protein
LHLTSVDKNRPKRVCLIGATDSGGGNLAGSVDSTKPIPHELCSSPTARPRRARHTVCCSTPSVADAGAISGRSSAGDRVVHERAGDDTAVNAPLDEFWRAIKLDLYGTFLGCRFGIPELIKASPAGSPLTVS